MTPTTSMTPAELVTEAIATLCWRAKVAASDGSPAAAKAVCAVLLRDHITGVRACPIDCPIARWFCEATGLPFLMVLMDRVRVATLQPVGMPCWHVAAMLPPAVVAAVAWISERRAMGLLSEVA